MIIRAVTTLAVYCQHCGKLHLHDITRFSLQMNKPLQLKCGCNHVQATLMSNGSRQYVLNIPCVMCQENHSIYLDRKKIWNVQLEKIYCVRETFELGFVGERQAIENVLAGQKREFDSLIREMGIEQEEQIENQQIMLEVLNTVHDIAEKGEVYCHCGSSAIGASLSQGRIVLECLQCGAHVSFAAQTEQDLSYVQSLATIELEPRRWLARGVDVD